MKLYSAIIDTITDYFGREEFECFTRVRSDRERNICAGQLVFDGGVKMIIKVVDNTIQLNTEICYPDSDEYEHFNSVWFWPAKDFEKSDLTLNDLTGAGGIEVPSILIGKLSRMLEVNGIDEGTFVSLYNSIATAIYDKLIKALKELGYKILKT